MKILILTDSLGLPRDYQNNIVTYEETYTYSLRKEFPNYDIIYVGIGGATIDKIYEQLCYYKVLNSDLTFIQCGVVDCAPRAFRKFESKVIKKLKLKWLFKPFIIFLRKYRKYRFTTPRKFNKYLALINGLISSKNHFYYLGILPASDEYEKVLPNMKMHIKKYNDYLQESPANFINNLDFPFEGLLDDHHHMNKIGHDFIFEKIKNIIYDHTNSLK